MAQALSHVSLTPSTPVPQPAPSEGVRAPHTTALHRAGPINDDAPDRRGLLTAPSGLKGPNLCFYILIPLIEIMKCFQHSKRTFNHHLDVTGVSVSQVAPVGTCLQVSLLLILTAVGVGQCLTSPLPRRASLRAGAASLCLCIALLSQAHLTSHLPYNHP